MPAIAAIDQHLGHATAIASQTLWKTRRTKTRDSCCNDPTLDQLQPLLESPLLWDTLTPAQNERHETRSLIACEAPFQVAASSLPKHRSGHPVDPRQCAANGPTTRARPRAHGRRLSTIAGAARRVHQREDRGQPAPPSHRAFRDVGGLVGELLDPCGSRVRHGRGVRLGLSQPCSSPMHAQGVYGWSFNSMYVCLHVMLHLCMILRQKTALESALE